MAEPHTRFVVSEDPPCEPKDGLAIPVLISVIATVGLFANSIVIFIVTVLKEYSKSVTNIYVLQLAIADFIFLFQLPFQARTMVVGQWTYGTVWCKLSESIKMLNYYASIMFLTVMSVDRYLAINYAMNQKVSRFRSKRAAFFISSILWLLSFLGVINILTYADVKECACMIHFPEEAGVNIQNMTIDFPIYPESGEGSSSYDLSNYGGDYNYNASDGDLKEFYYSDFFDEFLEDDTVCSYQKTQFTRYFKVWITCNFTLAFLLPLLIICVSYSLIIRRIVRPMVIGSKSQRSNKTRKRVTLMVTALVSAFVVCWLPYHAFHMARLNDVRMQAPACIGITNFTLVLAYSNSAVNPFFYTFLGTNFRRRWGIAIGKARKGLRQSIMSHSGDYTPGASMKARRRSSGASTSGANKHRDDASMNSFVTKHTVVPSNTIVKEEKV